MSYARPSCADSLRTEPFCYALPLPEDDEHTMLLDPLGPLLQQRRFKLAMTFKITILIVEGAPP